MFQGGTKLILFILFSWVLLLGAIKTLQHLSFGTNACDLSTQDYALASTLKGDFMADPFHQFAFGRWQRENGRLGFVPGRVRGWQSHFAVHFTPILILLLPLYALFPGPLTLIYLELISIALSAYFLYRIAEHGLPDRPAFHAAIVIVYLLYRQLIIAVMHDFHFELFFPALFFGAHYFLAIKRNYKLALLFICLALLVKEDIGIYLFFYGLFAIFKLKERKYGAIIAGVSLAYALAVFIWALPFFRSYQAGGSDRYIFSEIYGQGGPLRTAWMIFTHPGLLLQNVDLAAFLRVLVLNILLPLLFIPVSTSYALLFLPVFFVILASKLPQMYTFGIHYSVPFLPFLFLALLQGLVNIKKKAIAKFSIRRGQLVLRTLIAALFLINVMNSSLWRQVNPSRYRALATRPAVMALVKKIPPGASVAAQSALIPHIPKRKNIDMLPLGLGHDYVIIDGDINLWPYTRLEFNNLIRDLEAGGRYTLLEKKGEARLYQKIPAFLALY
jgi:uncharacterized membrane protein